MQQSLDEFLDVNKEARKSADEGPAARLASAFTSIRYRRISHFGEVILASNFNAKTD